MSTDRRGTALLSREPGLEQAHATSLPSALENLGVDPARGLSSSEAAPPPAGSAQRGPTAARRVTFWNVFTDEITEPMMLLLVAVAVLSGVWGDPEDTVAIVVIIAVVVLVEVFAEYRAKATIAALGRLSAPTAPVLRDGRIIEVPAEELVPGDVLPLLTGERVPADARLVEAFGLRVDESALTGESAPVEKTAMDRLPADTPLAERSNLAFAGTTVAAGRARAVVVATGMATELGRITGLVLEAKPPRTALQKAMRDLCRWLAGLALAFSVLIPLIGILGGQPWREMILTALTLAFATIPEELPIIISLVLGLGAYRLSRRHGVIKRLRAAETLGTVTVIATDKTGTLTEHRMRVSHLTTGGAQQPLTADPTPEQRRLLAFAAACHDAILVRHDDGLQISGDPTDVALLEAAHERGALPGNPGGLSGTLAAQYPFDTHRKSTSVIYRRPDGELLLIAKGAPESLLERCTTHRIGDELHPLTEPERAALLERTRQMAADGMRVLAVATRTLTEGWLSADHAERDLTLVGLAGLEDVPRPEVVEAIAAARRAGIRVVMITGDHPASARAVAEKVGLDAHGPLLIGPDLDRLDDAELAEAVTTTDLFARTTPEHKIRLVEALHARGEIVAMTGDGINDAPALSQADVGVAMGASGTDVARDAADLVLADDNFATITRAIGYGRQLFDNLRKGVRYYLACKTALIATTAVPVLLGLPVPFTPVQIVVMEMFMDIAGSATFAVERGESDTMTRPPRDPRRRFLDRKLVTAIFTCGATLFLAVTAVYLSAIWTGATAETAKTQAFVTWMVGYLVLAWVMRSERTPLARAGWLSNRFLPAWSAVTAGSIALFMMVPMLRNTLNLTPLTASQWLTAILVPTLAVVWIEAVKWRPAHRNAPEPADTRTADA
ncbi:MAG TPA: cation-transporting P-type ATPase [Pseudonocardiaceae bacterium]|nr:cation-transporting P-type ATPase [Pseudonocardiaceae bacterium]